MNILVNKYFHNKSNHIRLKKNFSAISCKRIIPGNDTKKKKKSPNCHFTVNKMVKDRDIVAVLMFLQRKMDQNYSYEVA